MIDNVVLLITGTLHERDTSELLEKCHPLGMFDAMATLTVATNTQELFNSVLVDTPLAPYFAQCLSEEDLDEMNIEIIRNTLYKAYLEDFYQYCLKLGGDTADFMGQILQVRAPACARRRAWPPARAPAHAARFVCSRSSRGVRRPARSSRPTGERSTSPSTRSAPSSPRTTAPSCTRPLAGSTRRAPTACTRPPTTKPSPAPAATTPCVPRAFVTPRRPAAGALTRSGCCGALPVRAPAAGVQQAV